MEGRTPLTQAVSHGMNPLADGLREEVLPQRHFGSRLRGTALPCCNYHSSDPLLHGRFGN